MAHHTDRSSRMASAFQEVCCPQALYGCTSRPLNKKWQVQLHMVCDKFKADSLQLVPKERELFEKQVIYICHTTGDWEFPLNKAKLRLHELTGSSATHRGAGWQDSAPVTESLFVDLLTLQNRCTDKVTESISVANRMRFSSFNQCNSCQWLNLLISFVGICRPPQ